MMSVMKTPLGQGYVRGDLCYLAQLDDWEDVKPFQIVGTINPGQPRENFTFETHRSTIHNARLADPSGFSLTTSGFEWVKHITDEDMASKDSIDRYILVMSDFLKQHLQARLVRIYQYQVCMQPSLPCR